MIFKLCKILFILSLMKKCNCDKEFKANLLTKSFICPFYIISEYTVPAEAICSIMCQRRMISEYCRGFCFYHETSTCELYGIPQLGANSQVLKWISIKNLNVNLNFTSSYKECKKNDWGLVLPMSDEEQNAMSKMAGTTFYLDLFDVNKTEDSRTYEGNRKPVKTYFLGGQPDSPNHDCVRGHYGGKGEWDDYFCTTNNLVLCQDPKPFACVEGEFFNGTTPDSTIMSCYKFT